MKKHPTPLKSIRIKCLDCCCGSEKEVRLCTVDECALYPYRFGKNPHRAGHAGGFAQKGKSKSIPTNEF